MTMIPLDSDGNVIEFTLTAAKLVNSVDGLAAVIARGIAEALPLAKKTGGFEFNVTDSDECPPLLVQAWREPSVASGFKIRVMTRPEWDALMVGALRHFAIDPTFSPEDREAFLEQAEDAEKELARKCPEVGPRLGAPQICN